MRVIVSGSRTWTDREFIRAFFITECAQDTTIVHGACPSGADAIAADLAPLHGFRVEAFPPDWQSHGKAAGPIRNQVMLTAGADLVVAFWDGSSRGTRHMIAIARAAGVPVRVFTPEESTA